MFVVDHPAHSLSNYCWLGRYSDGHQQSTNSEPVKAAVSFKTLTEILSDPLQPLHFQSMPCPLPQNHFSGENREQHT